MTVFLVVYTASGHPVHGRGRTGIDSTGDVVTATQQGHSAVGEFCVLFGQEYLCKKKKNLVCV